MSGVGEKSVKHQWVPIVAAIITASAVVVAAYIGADAKRQVTALSAQAETLNAQNASLKRELAAAQERLKSVGSLDPNQSSPNPTVHTSVPVSSAVPTNNPRVVLDQEFSFELKGCALSGSLLKCDLLITNKAGERVLGFKRSERSRIIDDEGRIYTATYFTLGQDVGRGYVQVPVPAEIPVQGEIQFDGVKPPKMIKLLEVDCYVDDSRKMTNIVVGFNNVTL